MPYVPGGVTEQELGGGRAVIVWNAAGSTPTVLSIEPSSSEVLKLLPPTATPEEARARFAEFIDLHPELFGAPSSDFDLSASPFDAMEWRLGALQNHRGLPVEGGYIQLDVWRDGRLWLFLNARTFPADDLSRLDLEPAVGPEEAIALVRRTFPGPSGGDLSEPELRIGFRCKEPIPTWFIDSYAFEYVIAGDTGEVLSVALHFCPIFGDCLPMSVFVRGDASEDGSLDLSDAVRILTGLFLSRSGPECVDAADSNDDGHVDISDAIYDLSYLFLGGPSPPPPFPQAGADLTIDELPCQRGVAWSSR